MNIKNKVVIVIGASSGIGLATAVLLAKKSAKVVLAARSKDKLSKLAKKLPYSLAIPTDMTKENEIKQMINSAKKHFGRIDILINNAGQGYDAPVESIDIDTFHKLFSLDIVGPLIAMQQVIPIMRKQGGGTIVNISSGTALMYLANMSAYSSLKKALAGISLTAREELAKENITVSVVYPYITLTDFEKNTIKDSSIRPEPEEENSGGPRPPDTAEYIAQKILQGIESGEAEIFAHDWMKNL
jgi:short-subunit dehydrogenase